MRVNQNRKKWLKGIFFVLAVAGIFALALNLLSINAIHGSNSTTIVFEASKFSVYDPYKDERVYFPVDKAQCFSIRFDVPHHEPYLQIVSAGAYRLEYFLENEHIDTLFYYTGYDHRDNYCLVEHTNTITTRGFDEVRLFPALSKSFWLRYLKPVDLPNELPALANSPRAFRSTYYSGANFDRYTNEDVKWLNAYIDTLGDNHLSVLLSNYSSELKIIPKAIVNGDNVILYTFSNTAKILSQTQITLDAVFSLQGQLKSDLYLQYIYDVEEPVLRLEKINPYKPNNTAVLNGTSIRTRDNMANHKDVTVDEYDGVVTFAKSEIVLDSPLFIPEGYRFVLEAGQKIILDNNAYIMTRSPLFVQGTEESPVILTCSNDSEFGGLVIMQAAERSRVEYLRCDNLGEVVDGIYHLTGAVTFYESDVDIFYSEFLNNRSEDGLNTVRSDILIENCLFQNTLQDAYDSDFCTGAFRACTFRGTGNDALDVSTSQMVIEDCSFFDIHDKAVSAGEASTVAVKNLVADRVQTGLGAKDNSVLTASNVTISNADFALCTYQKKPEFGPSILSVTNMTFGENIDMQFLTEERDEIYVDGVRHIPGNTKKSAYIIERLINEVPLK
jgi:hypothetical protein